MAILSKFNVQYFTMIHGVIDVSTGHMAMWHAVHPTPIQLSEESAKATALDDGGMPVGFRTEAGNTTIDSRLEVGYRLYLFSDGMIECENEYGEFYGTERLKKKVQDWRNLTITVLGELFDSEITRLNGTETFDDDVSMVVLEYKGKR